MKIGRFEITKWDYPEGEPPTFIWFEYLRSGCSCRFLTIFNILFSWKDKDCK